MKITKNMYINHTVEARELELYADNTRGIYESSIVPVVANLRKKALKGTFDEMKAQVAFYHVATKASNLYYKDFGYRFTVTERWTAAYNLLLGYMDEIMG